ncbi:MAG: squalene--hopene cyclase, partial [bacterium]|nr:squalene--hopene cyclase [bacterium]
MSDTIETTLSNAAGELLALRDPDGGWTGRLSSSALSTATATVAMECADRQGCGQLISSALEWLAEHVNDDGGWGDTPQSMSNLPTTLLVWSAFAGRQSGVV